MGLEVQHKHQQKMIITLLQTMNKANCQRTLNPITKPSISIATIYPIQLPKLKFYTERAIHEPDQSNKQSKQIPITFIRYLKNKQKKRYSSMNDNRQLSKQHHQSMYVTNSLQKEKKGKATLTIDQFRCKTQPNQQSVALQSLIQKAAMNLSKDREIKSKLLLNYYKKKYLKYRCRKSIDLEDSKDDCVKKSLKNINLLADGLKIEKIEIADTPKVQKEIINKAKFNSIISNQGGSVRKKWEIGPWHFKTEFQTFDN